MRSSAVLLALVVGAASARANEVDDVLQRVDQAISSTNNKVWVVKMRIIAAGGGDVREARMLMLQGGVKRILRFLAPAQMRNTAMLALGNNEFYVYLPSEGRTRRLGASNLAQTFLGADFTFEDLADVSFRERYDGKIVERRGEDTLLELLPKAQSNWSRLKISVEPHGLIRRIEYFDKSGKHARTQTRYFEHGKAQYETWVPVRVLMVNELTKHASELIMQVADPEGGIPAEVFTLRGMQRGDDLRLQP